MINKDLILCIETTTAICSVALSRGETLIALQEHQQGFAHARVLTVFIQQIFEQTNYTYQDLAAIAISAGPGSYTGLRIGTATAKGMCYALNIPLLPIPTLKALAYHTIQTHPNPSALYVSMMDARRMDVYRAAYNIDLQETISTQIVTLTNQMFHQHALNYNPIFVMGNALDKCQSILNQKNIQLLGTSSFSAAHLIPLAVKAYHQGKANQQFTAIAYYEPFYLKEYKPNKRQKHFF